MTSYRFALALVLVDMWPSWLFFSLAQHVAAQATSTPNDGHHQHIVAASWQLWPDESHVLYQMISSERLPLRANGMNGMVCF